MGQRVLRSVPTGRSSIRVLSRALSVSAIAILLLLSYHRGKDVNFDQLNSHAALSFDFFHGHVNRDVPYGAAFGTLLPAFWNAPWWVASSRLPDWQTGFLLVAWAIPIVFTIRRLTRVLFRNSESPLLVEGLALICGLSSVSFLTELGTTFGNLPTGMFVLLGITILVEHMFGGGEPRWYGPLLAGLLTGVGVGMKWTNGVYVVATLVALLVVPLGRAIAVKYTVTSCLSASIVALPWMIAAWSNYGSPLYPWYNNIFQSKFFDPIAPSDPRWGLSPLDLLSFPWTLANGTKSSGEVMAADARLLVFGCGVLLLVLLTALRRPRQAPLESVRGVVGSDQPLLFLTILVVISYMLWGSLFGVQRHFLVGEILAGLVALRLWSRIIVASVANNAASTLRLSIVPLLLVASVNVPNFGHVRWSGKTWYQFNTAGLDVDATDTVIFENTRIAYVSTIFRADAQRIGLSALEYPGFRLQERIRARLARASRPISVFLSDKTLMNTSLAPLGLRLTEPCGTIGTAIENVNWCRVERSS